MYTESYKPTPSPHQIESKVSTLPSPWFKDTWQLSDSEFSQYGFNENSSMPIGARITFNLFPKSISTEAKFFLYDQITNRRYTIRTAYTSGSMLRKLALFLSTHYPEAKSILDLDINKALKKYKFYLHQNGLKNPKTIVRVLQSFYESIFNFYDTRNEYDKEIWDIRNIPHAEVEINYSRYKLSFKGIGKPFVNLAKDYCWYALTFKSSGRIYNTELVGIRSFFNFIELNHKDWTSLNNLTRKEWESYLVFFHQKFNTCNWNTKNPYLTSVKIFLEYLQAKESDLAPLKPLIHIIFPNDIPKKQKHKDSVKHIPENIIMQLQNILDQNPKDLNPRMPVNELEYVPVAILQIATGWRTCDLLNLRYHKCLLKIDEQTYYLQGDINKTRVSNHRVPIEKDVAKLLELVIEARKKISTDFNNPNKFLFARMNGTRRGRPYSNHTIQTVLNKWAKRYNIVDMEGKIYHFKNHGFRHSKGVELINLGMNLTHIMKWFAHSSPEMTLTYAKISDDTLRKEWEKATIQKGPLLKVDVNRGSVEEMELSEDLIQWEYIRSNIEASKVPLGYCMASKKEGCPFVITPCLDNCPNFCTTPEHIPEFEKEIQNVKDVLERTKDMPIYNEKNQKQLDNLLRIKDSLEIGIHFNGMNAKKAVLEAQIAKERILNES